MFKKSFLKISLALSTLIFLFSSASWYVYAQDTPIADGFINPGGDEEWYSAIGYFHKEWSDISGCYHPGIDLNGGGATENKEVHAIANGKIIFSGYSAAGFGEHIGIEHQLPTGESVVSHYAHLNTRYIETENITNKKDVIGLLGRTGVGSGPHLHFEIRKNDPPIDENSWPKKWWTGEVQLEWIDENYYDPLVFIEEHRNFSGYIAQRIGQNDSHISMLPGEIKDIWVEFKNVGTETWLNHGDNMISMHTDNPQDRQSPFASGNWINPNRPTNMEPQEVKPQETVRFWITLTAPADPGDYQEDFNLVVENKEWMTGGKFSMPITVVNPNPEKPSAPQNFGPDTSQSKWYQNFTNDYSPSLKWIPPENGDIAGYYFGIFDIPFFDELNNQFSKKNWTKNKYDLKSSIFQLIDKNNAKIAEGLRYQVYLDKNVLSHSPNISLDEGLYGATIAAKDTNGNIGEQSLYYFTIDTSPPSSHVDNLADEQENSAFEVKWEGEDHPLYLNAASGIAYFDIQYKEEDKDWKNWLSKTKLSSKTFTGEEGKIYYFRSRAYDNLGNLEEYPEQEDVKTKIKKSLGRISNLKIINAYSDLDDLDSMTLSWTVPQDLENIGNLSYDIRYQNTSSENFNWDNATQIENEPAISNSGEKQDFTIQNLEKGKKLSFAIKIYDGQRYSGISNIISYSVPLPNEITEDLTLNTLNSPYVAIGGINIIENKTLLINPGVAIKFGTQESSLNTYGAIDASGKSDKKIIFTSLRDDTAQGDTNWDQDTTSPSGAEWSYIGFMNSSPNELTYCEIKYGGSIGVVFFLDNSIAHLNNILLDSADTISIYASNSSNISVENSLITNYAGGIIGENSQLYIYKNNLDSQNLDLKSINTTQKNYSQKSSVSSEKIRKKIEKIKKSYKNNPNSGIEINEIIFPYMAIMLIDSSAQIKNNTLTNNNYGVYVTGTSNPNINQNNIQENSWYGVFNDSLINNINAEQNWWGHASGPSGNGPGQGDAVNGMIDYAPWRTTPVSE